jgi:hypothetical protein
VFQRQSSQPGDVPTSDGIATSTFSLSEWKRVLPSHLLRVEGYLVHHIQAESIRRRIRASLSTLVVTDQADCRAVQCSSGHHPHPGNCHLSLSFSLSRPRLLLLIIRIYVVRRELEIGDPKNPIPRSVLNSSGWGPTAHKIVLWPRLKDN